ncbi:MAG: FG-GAP-like repeat-containing protein [Candidatus Cloacimonadaceae bacterium]
MKRYLVLLATILCLQSLSAQPWEADNSVFNPSGVPSLTFSQPRFTDLDGDGDFDFFLGSSNRTPLYIENTGTASHPIFTPGTDLTSGISSLDADVAVCADLDNDGDLDLVTGGFTGLHLFLNTGTTASPVYAEAPGYFSGILTSNFPIPDLADVDNDGDLDLVVGFSENGSVRLFFNTGTPASGQFSQANSLEIGDVGLYAYPIFCDLDADNDQDILVGRDLHGFVYYQNNGTPSSGNWQTNSALFSGLGMQDYWNSPDLVDLNNDGLFDLVFGTASGPLHYYVNTGTPSNPSWQANTALFGGVLDVGGASSPVFFDFDNDGDLDLISGSQLGDIKYYRNIGTPHAPAWQHDSSYFTSIDHSIYAAVTIGDVNGDNLPDAIIGDLSGHLYYHRNTGTGFVQETGVLSSVALGGWSVPRLLDMDGDGDLDLAVGNESGMIYYYLNQGTPLVPDWVLVPNFFQSIDIGTNCSPAFGDIDNDGDLDFVTGDMWGDLRCYLRQGHSWVLNNTLISGIMGDQNTAPALVDLDADGDLDLVLGDYDGTFRYFRNLMYSDAVLNPPLNLTVNISAEVLLSWIEPVPGSTSPFQHYNIYLDGELSGTATDETWTFSDLVPGTSYTVYVTAQYIAGESAPAVIDFQFTGTGEHLALPLMLQSWPNPFSLNTTIRFSVKARSNATLTIYNVKGQIVKKWQSFSAGEHSVNWDGRDEHGHFQGTGIYLLRLQSSSGCQLRKLMIN